MKNLKFIACSLIIFISCKEQKKTDLSVITVAHGQMPVLAKDANKNIYVVYGSGDSIMYTYSG